MSRNDRPDWRARADRAEAAISALHVTLITLGITPPDMTMTVHDGGLSVVYDGAAMATTRAVAMSLKDPVLRMFAASAVTLLRDVIRTAPEGAEDAALLGLMLEVALDLQSAALAEVIVRRLREDEDLRRFFGG
ncbi:hypothetical protein [Spongiactinospora sp. TRM90649]|uniref:hypothetical protein n=1 Tax=Spongiactinospora sp. TRM90649 TaxID=3031114 RepID=UPI0023F69D9A|nr:hypothetical protein [Spongiactinospora sp. TRM90649]MDF5756624.1 hypothetical protein [Spongiactinospora sp. TRM90649]